MSDSKQQGQDACPVDHKSREAWLQQARTANPEPAPSQSLPASHPTVATTAAESCPVDHKSREAWLQQARAAGSGASEPPHPIQSAPSSAQTQTQSQPPTSTVSSSWTSYLPRIPFFASPASSSTAPAPSRPQPTAPGLGNDREISTIPRSSTPGDAACRPANDEQETGADKTSGNWIYPSERMFFEAMKRKGHDPQSADMRSVVPIHNAVNERAWAEIKAWEGPWVRGSSCDGPRLHSFTGLGTAMSPKARVNSLLGYQAPFDRHDWVVDRCGKEVEYVIDFYEGRRTGADGKLSFYLDVRPKLNSWEGVKMRAFRAAGMS